MQQSLLSVSKGRGDGRGPPKAPGHSAAPSAPSEPPPPHGDVPRAQSSLGGDGVPTAALRLTRSILLILLLPRSPQHPPQPHAGKKKNNQIHFRSLLNFLRHQSRRWLSSPKPPPSAGKGGPGQRDLMGARTCRAARTLPAFPTHPGKVRRMVMTVCAERRRLKITPFFSSQPPTPPPARGRGGDGAEQPPPSTRSPLPISPPTPAGGEAEPAGEQHRSRRAVRPSSRHLGVL